MTAIGLPHVFVWQVCDFAALEDFRDGNASAFLFYSIREKIMNGNDMIYGVDYYPEHWDCNEWETQAAQMKDCGFNTVRMAEFAWKLFEAEEGKFDFSLMDEVISVLSKYDIKVILGTPTAAPPKWLCDKYDVLLRDRYGRKRAWGSRRECCANSPDYILKSKIIVEEMAKHYADNPNIIGWQIDNEFGCHNSTVCFCENCRKKFGEWLSKKYGTIENLNKTWGTVFWSLQFDSFDDIILPGYNSCEGECNPNYAHNPSLDLDFRRFSSDSWVEYQKMQIDIIRKYSNLPVTHNMMGHFSDIDYYKLGEELDYVSWDNYPDNQWGGSDYEYVSMAHETMRGVKNRNFVVMEEQSGPCGWDRMGITPRPGQLKLWAYQAVAHGAEGIVFFRFRAALFGMEQYWYGVIGHDGKPGRRYYELKEAGSEFKRMKDYIVGAQNDYSALIFKSYDNSWAHQIKRHTEGFDYGNILYSFYKANAHNNVTTAVSNGTLNDYKIVYMPAYNVLSREDAQKVERYVAEGGVLVLSFRSGTRDEYNNMRPETMPGPFSKLAGIEIPEFDALRRPVAVKGRIVGKASYWCDIIECTTAEPICVYGGEFYKGKAAITKNRYGHGTVYYVGCDLNDEAMDELVKMISEENSVECMSLPYGVECIKRRTALGEKYYMILNYNEEPVKVNLKGTSLINNEVFDGNLAGYGVEIVGDLLWK